MTLVPWDPWNTYLDSPNTALANLNLAKQLISYQESDAAANQLPQNRTRKSEFEARAIESDLDKIVSLRLWESKVTMKGSPKRVIILLADSIG